MLQNTSKTLGFQKIMIYKTPPGGGGGGGVNHIWLVAYEANLMKLQRKIKHNEKVCRAHDLGSYAGGQGGNQVKGQNFVSAITQKLMKQI